jgi:hypothetical protein
MTRSTEEWEISRSCHSATFSSAGVTDARIDLREGADGARDGAGGDFLARRDQALFRTRKFRVGVCQLQPERHRFGMDAV